MNIHFPIILTIHQCWLLNIVVCSKAIRQVKVKAIVATITQYVHLHLPKQNQDFSPPMALHYYELKFVRRSVVSSANKSYRIAMI